MVKRTLSAPSVLTIGVSASCTANQTSTRSSLPSKGAITAAAIAATANPTHAPAPRGSHPLGVYAGQDDQQTAPAAHTTSGSDGNGLSTPRQPNQAPTPLLTHSRQPIPQRVPVRGPLPWPGIERRMDPEEERRFRELCRRVQFTLSPPPTLSETSQEGSPTQPSSPAFGNPPGADEVSSPFAAVRAPVLAAVPAPAAPHAAPPASDRTGDPLVQGELRPIHLSSLSLDSDRMLPNWSRL